MCLHRQIDFHKDNLGRLLNTFNLPSCLWSDRCDYKEVDKCINLNPMNYNFVSMQLNIRSLLLNQVDLQLLLNGLSLKNSAVDALMLSEMFITSKTEKLINMKGYSIHTMNRVNSKGGGTALLINKEIKHKRRKYLEIMIEKEAESTFIEMIAKNGKKFVIGSLYRAPNTREDTFINYVKETIHKIKSEKGQKEIILGMDQNLNPLKANQHKGTSQFLDIMMDFDMIPTITRPTRITNTMATLIDNIYISGKIQCNYKSHLILSDISDHLPSLLLLKQTKVKDKIPIEFESRNLNDDKIMQINNELRNTDWNGRLNSNNCNTNVNTFCSEIKAAMDKVAPIKTIRISGRWKFMEPWLTTGLERSSRSLNKLYTASLREGVTENEKKCYREFRNIYN